MEIILIAMAGAVILGVYLVGVLTTPVCVSEHGRFKRHCWHDGEQVVGAKHCVRNEGIKRLGVSCCRCLAFEVFEEPERNEESRKAR
jgi:hypothetical protein